MSVFNGRVMNVGGSSYMCHCMVLPICAALAHPKGSRVESLSKQQMVSWSFFIGLCFLECEVMQGSCQSMGIGQREIGNSQGS